MITRRTLSTCFRVSALAVLVGLPLLPQPVAAQTTVDDFTVAQGFQLRTCPGDVGTPITNFAADGLGGERDITLTMLACTFAGTTSSTLVAGGTFVLNNGTAVEGQAVIQWDGVDGSAVLNPTGLGGVDLTAVGQDTFRLRVTTDDLTIPVTIDVYTDGANASRCTFNLPGGIVVPTDFGFGFPGTTPNCTFAPFLGGGANFANVGAIELTLGGAGFAAVDVTLDFLRTDSGAVPVELLEFGIFDN